MNLVRAELRRLFKRRVTFWMLLAVLGITGLTVAGVGIGSEKIGPEQLAEAERQAEAEYQEALRYHNETIDDQVADCEREQANADAGDQFANYPPGFDCEEIRQWAPQRENFDPQWYLPPSFHFRAQFGELITGWAALLALFGFLVGASFVGAEWRTGGMMNLLLWQPRRVRVLATKLGALLGALTGIAVVTGALWTGSFWLVAHFGGITETMTSGAWQSFGLSGLRGLVLALAATAAGFALASLGRHAAMALGAAVAAVVVGLLGVLIVMSTLGVRWLEAWLWVTYIQAWMEGSVVLYDYQSCDFAFGACEPATMEITWQVAGLGLGAATIALIGAAMWQIRLRDVT